MLIHKVLNNNVVIVLDESNQEQVVTGRGLAFKKKVGDSLDETAITQIFTLAKHQPSDKIQELLTAIPVEIMEVVEEIVSYARETLKKEIHDSVYITLMDHINSAIERHKQGIEIKNILLWDIKRFFQKNMKLEKKG